MTGGGLASFVCNNVIQTGGSRAAIDLNGETLIAMKPGI